MKPLILFFFFFVTIVSLSFQSLHAQATPAAIPNGDFENWANGAPVGWYVDDTTFAGTRYAPITQTSDAESGSSALEGTVLGVLGIAEVPPLASCGGTSTGGFPYTDQPNSFTGYYKFNPVGEDSLSILCVFTKGGIGIGACSFFASSSASAYTEFAVPIEWSSADAPDSAYITISIVATYTGSASAGSTMEVDNLAFSNTVISSSVSSTTSTFDLGQNYPNPLTNTISTSIQYSLDEPGYATLTVYDINGRVVETPVQEVQSAGNHLATLDCSRLAAGVYTYRLTCGDHSTAKMMQVLH
jgi:Secretion system C-terminal sorting domain